MLPIFKHTPLGGWTPLNEDGVDGGVIRLYTSDKGVTSSGSATRVRAGVQCAAMGGTTAPVKAWSLINSSPDAFLPVDGQGFFELDSGRFLLVGGSPGGYGIDSCNTVWYSDDRGRTWGVLLAPEQDRDGVGTGNFGRVAESVTRFKRGHTLGFMTHTQGGVRYCYVIGGDPAIAANAEVWRTPASGDGTSWTMIADDAPLVLDTVPDPDVEDRTLFLCWSLGGKMYIGGGQPSAARPEPNTSVYESNDGGYTWTLSTDATPMDVGVSQVLGQLPEIDGSVYLVGGGTNHDPVVPPDPDENAYYNAVKTFDVTNGWQDVLAEGHGGPPAQFPPVRYLSVVREVGSERLWKFNGAIEGDSDTALAQYSDNRGATWQTLTPLPWDDTHAQAALATKDGVYLTHGFQSTKLFVVRSETGRLVSVWRDQHPEAFADPDAVTHLRQEGDDSLKPMFVPKMFGGKPGIVANGVTHRRHRDDARISGPEPSEPEVSDADVAEDRG